MKIWLFLLQLIQTNKMNTPEEKEKENGDHDNQVPEKEEDKVGLRDDLILLLFLVPVIGVFLPWTRDGIKEGLVILNDIPDWFSFIIVLGVISLFGLRKQLTDILTNLTNFRKK